MLNNMQAYIRAFQSERIKINLKKIIIASVIIALVINLPDIFFTTNKLVEIKATGESYVIGQKILDNVLQILTILIYPITLVAITTSIINTDLKNDGFKLLETQHLGRKNIFLAKLSWTLIISALILIVILLSTFLTFGYHYILLLKIENVDWSIEWWDITSVLFRIFIANLAFLGIVMVLMYSIKKPIIVNILSFLLIITALIMSLSQSLPSYLPLYYSFNASQVSLLGNFITPFEYASILLFISTSIIAYQFYTHRNYRFLVFKDFKSLGIITCSLLFGIGLTYFILIPKSVKPSFQTIVEGSIKPLDNEKIEAISLKFLDNDSILNVTVDKNGKFKKEITLTSHRPVALAINDSTILTSFSMHANDSVYVELIPKKTYYKRKITGTIGADLQLAASLRLLNTDTEVPDWYMNTTPDYVLNMLEENYYNNLKEISNKTTPDNYTFSATKLKQIQSILKVQTIELYNNFSKRLENEKPADFALLKPTPFLSKLESTITEEDREQWNNKQVQMKLQMGK